MNLKNVPKLIKNQIKPQKDLPRRQFKFTEIAFILDLAIGQHLVDKKNLQGKIFINWFSILAIRQLFFLFGNALNFKNCFAKNELKHLNTSKDEPQLMSQKM